MSAWLYQMAEGEDWTPEDYRLAIWEGESVTWGHGKVISRDAHGPGAGDPVIFFFAKSRTRMPGICGWGVILNVFPRKRKIKFRAVFPTDLLKMYPIWDRRIEVLINAVRGPHPRATMWKISAVAYDNFCRRILDYSGSARRQR